MLSFGPAVDQLRSDNVPHGISHENCGCHDGFLGGASHIAGANGDDKANYRSEEASERIARNWRGWLISPLRLPDHHTAGYHRKAAGNQHRNPRIGDAGGDVSTQRDEDDTNASDRKLE